MEKHRTDGKEKSGISKLKIIVIIMMIFFAIVDVSLYHMRYNRASIDVTHLYFSIEPRGTFIETTVEIYMENYGHQDSGPIDLEVLALLYDRDASNEYVEKVKGNSNGIMKAKTEKTAVSLGLTPQKYTIKVNVFQDGLFVESDSQVVTLTQEDAIPEGNLTRTEIPEFTSLSLPITSLSFMGLLASTRRGRKK